MPKVAVVQVPNVDPVVHIECTSTDATLLASMLSLGAVLMCNGRADSDFLADAAARLIKHINQFSVQDHAQMLSIGHQISGLVDGEGNLISPNTSLVKGR